jgi:hypothetical protein
MMLKELEAIRDSIQTQLDGHLRNPAAPGQEAMKHCNAIELLAAVRTVEQIIVQERAALAKPPGALGPTLVGV